MPAISVSVKPNVYIDLLNAADNSGDSKSKIVNTALENYFNELKQDKIDAKDAETAWNNYINSNEPALTADEVYKMAGL